MTIKSFFAVSVTAAIREARKQLGEEAVLLNSRRAPDDCRHLGAYEVVFGLSRASRPTEAARVTEGCDTSTPILGFDPSRQRRRLPQLEELYSKLTAAGIDDTLAVQLIEGIETRLPAEGVQKAGRAAVQGLGPGKGTLERVIVDELARRFPRDSRLEAKADRYTVAVFGPAGSGKTSALVRLAVSHGLALGRRPVLLSANEGRVAATERVRRYASLLEAEYRAVQTVDDLRQALENRSKADLVLIDTPGFGPRDMKRAWPLSQFLAERDDVQRHLVLPATMKRLDLRCAVSRFEPFQADRLLFTKLDETTTFGPILSEAALARKPISFLTTGQQIPGDLVAASRLNVLEWLGGQDDLCALVAA